MKWTKGKCELCEFWKRDRRVGAGVEASGNCLYLPNTRATFDTQKCGQFKKVSRREMIRRRALTEKVAATKPEWVKQRESREAEIKRKQERFVPKGK